MDQADFPWRQLGTLLVDGELLTPAELDRALAEQRRTGKLLGQILVDQGAMSGVELARALARQHGVELRAASGFEADEGITKASGDFASQQGRTWRPLGAVLVDNGVVAELDLQEALEEKRSHQDRRLGEILVRRGHLTPEALASALAEQHGVFLETPMLAAELPGAQPEGPTYRVFAVSYEPADEQRAVLYEGPNLLDAADFACEYVDRQQPLAVEIERRDGENAETVWTYSRDRAAAEAASSKPLVETFGFDPTRWGVGS